MYSSQEWNRAKPSPYGSRTGLQVTSSLDTHWTFWRYRFRKRQIDFNTHIYYYWNMKLELPDDIIEDISIAKEILLREGATEIYASLKIHLSKKLRIYKLNIRIRRLTNRCTCQSLWHGFLCLFYMFCPLEWNRAKPSPIGSRTGLQVTSTLKITWFWRK